MTLFEYHPHPYIEERKKHHAPKVDKPPEVDSAYKRWNNKIAVVITDGVGTMTCAYVFAGIALLGLPQALKDTTAGSGFHPLPIVQWIAQTFLQLVLLSIIIVGQNVQAASIDGRAEATYQDADAVLHTSLEIQQHLAAQDAELTKQTAVLTDLIKAVKAQPTRGRCTHGHRPETADNWASAQSSGIAWPQVDSRRRTLPSQLPTVQPRLQRSGTVSNRPVSPPAL